MLGFKKLGLITLAVALSAGFLGSLEACGNRGHRRHAVNVEYSVSTTPLSSGSGCVGKVAVAVQAAPVVVQSSGCQGYQARASSDCGCGCANCNCGGNNSGRVGLFAGRRDDRHHRRCERLEARHGSVQYVEAAPAPVVNPEAKPLPVAPVSDDNQPVMQSAQHAQRYVQVCGPNGCYYLKCD